MSVYTQKANIFLKNSLIGIPNKTEDPLLSKLEDKIYTMGFGMPWCHGRINFSGMARCKKGLVENTF